MAPATISSWENLAVPKLPPRERISTYARFFATSRSIDDEPHLIPLEDLDDEETAAYERLRDELLGLREAVLSPASEQETAIARTWQFDDTGPATLVCAELPRDEKTDLADPSDPNYTELLGYADLDALVELHGHIRAENPNMEVFYRASSKITPDALSGHLILLGGVAWNDVTQRLSEMVRLPVRQIEDPSLATGEIFVTATEGKEQRFTPRWTTEEPRALREDVGLLARVPNPLNSSRTLTICNGIHSRGVLGAVRSLTDARLREGNEKHLASQFGRRGNFLILMRVAVLQGQAMTPDFHNPDAVLWSKGM